MSSNRPEKDDAFVLWQALKGRDVVNCKVIMVFNLRQLFFIYRKAFLIFNTSFLWNHVILKQVSGKELQWEMFLTCTSTLNEFRQQFKRDEG